MRTSGPVRSDDIIPMTLMKTRWLALAACATLLACGSSGSQSAPGGPSGPSAPPPGGVIGADTASWGFFNYTPDFTSGLTNARWGRVTAVMWPAVERPPGSGSYDWSDLDRRIGNARTAGINAVLVLKSGNGASFSDPVCLARVEAAPDSAFSNGRAQSSCPIKTEMEGAWTRWVTDVVERYDGDGRDDMPSAGGSVRVDIQIENEAANWELWDFEEPDRIRSADRYLRLLELAYQGKQAANPQTQVILSGLIYPNLLARCDGQPGAPGCGAVPIQSYLAFIKRTLSRPAIFDAVDAHFFAYYRFEPTYVDEGMAWVAEQMQRLGYQRPVHSLEWTAASMLHVSFEGYSDAFSRYFPYSGEFASPAAFQAMYAALDQPQNVVYREWFEAEQAKEFVKLFTNLLAAGATRLVHVQYSDFRPLPGAWDNVWWNWQGVIKYLGGTAVRKPSYYTYNLLAGRLSGFSSARRLGPGGDVRLYEFASGSGEPTYVLWTDGAERLVDLSAVTSRPSVRVTYLVTELDAGNQPITRPEETVPVSAVPVADAPVLLRPAP